MVRIWVRVGAFVFRLLGLVGNLLVVWGSGSVPADKGVGGSAQRSQQQRGQELSFHPLPAGNGAAEGRMARLDLQRVSSSLQGDLFLLMPFSCENLSDISSMLQPIEPTQLPRAGLGVVLLIPSVLQAGSNCLPRGVFSSPYQCAS